MTEKKQPPINAEESEPASPEPTPLPVEPADQAIARLEGENQRDWEGVRELIAADARLRVADAFAGLVRESPYFSNYERLGFAWQLAVGEVDGELAIMIMQREGADRFTPRGVIRVEVAEERITRIADFVHCPWVLEPATSVIVPPLANLVRGRELPHSSQRKA